MNRPDMPAGDLASAAVEARALHKVFVGGDGRELMVLGGVNLRVESGEAVAIVGICVNFNPPAASRSMLGVRISEPQHPRSAKPMSSARITMMFGRVPECSDDWFSLVMALPHTFRIFRPLCDVREDRAS